MHISYELPKCQFQSNFIVVWCKLSCCCCIWHSAGSFANSNKRQKQKMFNLVSAANSVETGRL
uniref:Uncharacterized protein n=1 Tax=Arundo donax TaxID=35708 RepID=A0A0A9GE45_ARUDO